MAESVPPSLRPVRQTGRHPSPTRPGFTPTVPRCTTLDSDERARHTAAPAAHLDDGRLRAVCRYARRARDDAVSGGRWQTADAIRVMAGLLRTSRAAADPRLRDVRRHRTQHRRVRRPCRAMAPRRMARLRDWMDAPVEVLGPRLRDGSGDRV